jgi:hypothetical protein
MFAKHGAVHSINYERLKSLRRTLMLFPLRNAHAT